jgi:hypothetical protein
MRSTAVREHVQRWQNEVTRFNQQFGLFDTDSEG